MKNSPFPHVNLPSLIVISSFGALAGIFAGISIGFQPLLVVFWVLLGGGILSLIYITTNFEFSLLGLLVVRSSLDSFHPLPSLFAVGFLSLAATYIIWLFLRQKSIQIDPLCCFFCGWTIFQGLWVILLPLGGLGESSTSLLDGFSEWLRVIVWALVYLAFLQFKDRIQPERAISILFLSMIVPLLVAFVQILAPNILPENLSPILGTRVSGTIGHSATFSTYLLLFIGLTWWKFRQEVKKFPWLFLMGVLVFLLVKAQSLTITISMLPVMLLVLLIPRLNLTNLLGLFILSTLITLFLFSTELGQERIASINETPLLNPEIDWSRSILLSQSDGNSFNWRIAQWKFLLDAWRDSPWLGYGLDTSSSLTIWENYAHNDYVRVLSEQGVIGLFGFLTFLAAQGIYLLRMLFSLPYQSPQRDLCLVLIAFFSATLVGMLAENLWTHTALYTYWWALVAMLSWRWDEKELNHNHVPASR